MRDGDAMGVARGLERCAGAGRVPAPSSAGFRSKRCRAGVPLLTAAPKWLAPAVDVLERREEQASEAPAEDLHWQEEVRAPGEPSGPVGRQASSGEDTVEMRVMVELLAPGMEHRQAADVRPAMLRVPGDILERLRHGPKEQAIEHTRVVEAQGTEDRRQRKDYIDVGRVKHLCSQSGEPLGRDHGTWGSGDCDRSYS